MTRHDGRAHDQLRDSPDHPRLAGPRRGQRPGRVRPHPGAVRGVVHRGGAALAQGQRRGLGDRRVRDAAALRPTPAPTASRSRAGSAGARTRSPGWSVAACAPWSTRRRWARTRSCSTVTCCRPTAARARPRSPARTSRSPTPIELGAAAAARSRRRPQPLTGSVAAVSVGVVGGEPVLDLDYVEDVTADTDMNVVMTGDGRVRRGAGHRRGASRSTATALDALLDLAAAGCAELTRRAAARRWPSAVPQ